jgi:hypothetical protein
VSSAAKRLSVLLADGEWHASEDVLLEMVGWSGRAVRRAAQELGVEYRREGFPSTSWWRLRAESGLTEEPAQPSRSLAVEEASERWGVPYRIAHEFIEDFAARGLVEISAGGVAVTERGREFLRELRWLPS